MTPCTAFVVISLLSAVFVGAPGLDLWHDELWVETAQNMSFPREDKGELSCRQDRPFSTRWKLVLGFAALLDWLATTISRRVSVEVVVADHVGHFSAIVSIYGYQFHSVHPLITGIILWLDEYKTHIGLAFSLCCSIYSIHSAERDAIQALRKIERRRFMRSIRNNLKTNTRKQPETNDNEYPYHAMIVYYAALVLEFLLLPVGFYLFLLKTIPRMLVPFTSQSTATHLEEMKELLESTYGLAGLPQEYRTFSNETKLALGFAIVKHSGTPVYKTARAQTKKRLRKESWRQGKSLLISALRHPLRFRHQARQAQSFMRWIAYLSPIVNATVSIRKNMNALILMYRQRSQRKLAEAIRKRMRAEMDEHQRRVQAAKIIQSTFRSYRERQACLEFLVRQQEIDEFAAKRLQRACRAWTNHVQSRKRRKRKELERLEGTDKKGFRGAKTIFTLAPEDQKRIFELRNELECSSGADSSIDQRLLMRPGSKFQIIWKSIFVILVIIELIGRGWRPFVEKEINKATGGRHTVLSKLQSMLIPPTVKELEECTCTPKRKKMFWIWRPAETCPSNKPWYCHQLYHFAQSTYSRVFVFVMEQFIFLMALMGLLDAPIAFFTGQYHPKSGALVPKPFFQRWFGLIIPLLINPKMEAMSKLVFWYLRSQWEVGPIRVYRWWRAFFFPAFVLLLDFMEGLWIRLAAYANRENETERLKQEHTARRRSSIALDRNSIFMGRRSSELHGTYGRRRSSIVPDRNSIFGGRLSSEFHGLDSPPRRSWYST